MFWRIYFFYYLTIVFLAIECRRLFFVHMTHCEVIGTKILYLNCSINNGTVNAIATTLGKLGSIYINILGVAMRRHAPSLVLLNQTNVNVSAMYYRPRSKKADLIKIFIDDMLKFTEVIETSIHLKNYRPDAERLPYYMPDVRFRVSYNIFGSLISNKTKIGFASFEGTIVYTARALRYFK